MNQPHPHPHHRRARPDSPRRGLWPIARGLFAMAGLAAVIGGVPWALLRFTTWPVTGVPTGEQISDFPAIAAEDSTIAAVFVVGIWIAWAVFVACVAVEVVGEVRGTAATHVPAAGPFQHVARTLVASVAMTFGSLGSLAPAGASTLDFAVSATDPAPAPTAADGDAGVVVDISPSPPDQHGTVDHDQPVAWEMVRVDDGDSAWDLAERHYGDGKAWLRLWEDNQTQPQPDGRRWTTQTDPIEPGWVLRVRATTATDTPLRAGHNGAAAPSGPPTDETDQDRDQAARPNDEPAPGPVEVTVQPGDNLWALAEDHLNDTFGHPAPIAEVAPYWARVVDANQDRLVEPGDPDLIFSGQQIHLPAVDPAPPATETNTPPEPSAHPSTSQTTEAPSTRPQPPHPPQAPVPPDAEQTSGTTGQVDAAPAATTPSSTTTSPSITTPDSPRGEAPTAAPATGQEDDHGDDGSLPWHQIGALSAVGVAVSVGISHAIQRRRQRRDHLHPRRVPRPSSNPGLHRDLMVAADEDAFEQLRAALGHLAINTAELGATCRPRIVQNDTDHIDVLLDTPSPNPPAGWHPQGDGAIWTCDPHQLLTIGNDHTPAATPLLVTLGRADHGGQLYIDLEAEGLIGLVGDPGTATDLGRAIVTELAHSPLADGAQVVVDGDLGTPALARLDRVTVTGEHDGAVDNLLEWAGQSHNALVANGWPNAFIARGLGAAHDALIPLVVVTDHNPDPADIDQFHALHPRAVALIVVGDTPDGATVIDCAPGRLTLPDLGLACTPQTLDDDIIDAVADLLDDAARPSAEQLSLLPALPAGPDHDDATATATSNGGIYQDPPYEILIRVLGDITIEGNTTHLTPKQTSVVTYIAVHRTVSADRAADALWPAPTKSRRRQLSNVVSDCRNALGGRHLPIAEDGRYRAGPELLTDLDLFERRVAAAAHQPPDLAIETLRGAIDLVRGPIFTYSSSDKKARDWAWIALEDWHSICQQKITAIAAHLADLYTATGDTRQAVEVIEHTRQIIPTDTALTEQLMEAHAANGNFTAVRRVYLDHVEALAHYDIDDPAESTTTLYEDLLGGPR